jgi:transcription initiation factor IIE alpha subunit
VSTNPKLNSKMVENLLNDGMTEDEICEILGITEEELNEAINVNNEGIDYLY